MSSSREARIALVLGTAAVLAVPLAGAVAAFTSVATLLHAVYVAVTGALALGFYGVLHLRS